VHLTVIKDKLTLVGNKFQGCQTSHVPFTTCYTRSLQFHLLSSFLRIGDVSDGFYLHNYKLKVISSVYCVEF
jgi:hypothetical protein